MVAVASFNIVYLHVPFWNLRGLFGSQVTRRQLTVLSFVELQIKIT